MGFQEASERLLKKKICMKCNASNPQTAKKCRKCGSKQLRSKKKRIKKSGA